MKKLLVKGDAWTPQIFWHYLLVEDKKREEYLKSIGYVESNREVREDTDED